MLAFVIASLVACLPLLKASEVLTLIGDSSNLTILILLRERSLLSTLERVESYKFRNGTDTRL
jgi:hypothetical protein